MPEMFADVPAAEKWKDYQRARDDEPKSWLVRLNYEEDESW